MRKGGVLQLVFIRAVPKNQLSVLRAGVGLITETITEGRLQGVPQDGLKREFLDRHSWLPIVLLVLLPLLVHLPLWISGRSIDPIWLVANVADSSPDLAGAPWTDPNVGYTSEALGRLAARDWIHGVVPWWNPFTGIGMPLAGELQPASFFLPFTFLFLLPEGLLWQQICMQVIAGLGTYALLRELRLSRMACLMGGALYGLNGTISWAPGPAAVYCGVAFLPLQLLGVEISRKAAGGAKSVLVFGLAVGWALLAGFPEPSYIGGLLVLVWALYRFFADGRERWRILRRTGMGFVLGLLIAAPVLIAFVDYVGVSDSVRLHNYGEHALPWAALSATLLPYIYGLVGGTYQSPSLDRIWGDIGGYCGVLLIVLAIVGMLAKTRERGLRWLLTAWVLICMAKTFGVQPVQFLMNYLPLLRQTQFFRYSPPSWVLALILLAAFGLDDFREASPKRRYAYGVVLGLVTLAVIFAWPGRAFWDRPHSRESFMFVFLVLSLAWAMACLLTSLGAWTWMRGERRRTTLAALLVVDAAVMFTGPQMNSVQKGRVDEMAIDFLKEHQGLSRTYALGAPLAPNYGAYFAVAAINHNVLPVPKLWKDYLLRHLDPRETAVSGGVVFSPLYTERGSGERGMSKDPSSVTDLGVRYLITNPGWTPVSKQFIPSESSLIRDTPLKLKVLSKLSEIREQLNHFVENPARLGVERRLAEMVLRRVPGGSLPVGNAASETQQLTLQSGQSLEIELRAPAPVPVGARMTAVALVLPGNPGASSAKLRVRLCDSSECGTGERLLSDLKGDGFLEVPLDPSLQADMGTLLHLSVTYEDGEKPLKLPSMAPIAGWNEQLRDPHGAITDRVPDLAFNYGEPLPGARRVYADALMDIWELQTAAPYFEVTRGGPCSLQATQRENVAVVCTHPAMLRRRELYMPGWSVAVNGGKAVPVQPDGIFESMALGAGSSRAHFRFVPPHEGIGWAACFAGLGGLLWQLFRITRKTLAVTGG